MSRASNDAIKKTRKLQENPYAYLDDKGRFDALLMAEHFHLSNIEMKTLLVVQKHKNISHRDTEALANKVHKLLWKHKKQIWTNGIPFNPIDMLDPPVMIGILGYKFTMEESLGQLNTETGKIEAAGIIDQNSKRVSVSRQLPLHVQRFTAAHELGHALLHQTSGLHRDRPVDGSNKNISRNRNEMEADKFASCFLMPRKLVKSKFFEIFETEAFELNNDTLYALGPTVSKKLDTNFSIRDLSRIIASIEMYGGKDFYSLAKQFHVSVETMAIRLEELNLINI